MTNSTEQTIDVLMAAVVVSPHNARKNLEAGSEDAGQNDLAQSIETMGLIKSPSLRDPEL